MNKFMLVGLGNPGSEYDSTRHNAGKLFTRYLREHPIEGVEAVETECYMNESGKEVARILATSGLRAQGQGLRESQVISDSVTPSALGLQPLAFVIVAHDDLDIPLGKFKIQFGKGPRQHKGILSIEGALGTEEFWRVRIGIDARKKEEGKRKKEILGEEYVLQSLSREERKAIDALFPEIREQLRILFRSI